MPKGYKPHERRYYKANFFAHRNEASAFNLTQIMSRPTELLTERYDFYATDIFFFSHEAVRYFGRKILSSLHVEGKQKSKKCPQITAPMIIGIVTRDQVTQDEVLIFHKKLTEEEKVYIFNRIKINLNLDLYYPYPYMKEGKEPIQDTTYWEPTTDQVANLNAGEEIIRQYTVNFLKRFDLEDKKIFDPACSTGMFLGTLKTHYPQIRAIGQDLNGHMIAHAQTHAPMIDEFHTGDSLNTPIPDESMDFVIFRFLNVAVVSNQAAVYLFSKLANCCKNNGHIIVFGHSPVLLSKDWFEILGLQVEQTIAYNAENDSIYQYYVLKKNSPVPNLTYNTFSALHLNAQPTAMNHSADIVEEDDDNEQRKRMKITHGLT